MVLQILIMNFIKLTLEALVRYFDVIEFKNKINKLKIYSLQSPSNFSSKLDFPYHSLARFLASSKSVSL